MQPTQDGSIGAPHRSALVLAGVALVALGLLNLAWRDPLLQWQPMAPGSPWRQLFGVTSGAILLVAGALLLVPRTRLAGAGLGAAWAAAWTIALHLPLLAAGRPTPVLAALGVAESGAIALGFASAAWPVARCPAGRAALGLCLVVFGLSHFVYADFTAGMVPAWLPARHAIALATGAVHAATGLAVIAGVRVALALLVEAAMMASFVLLLHLPAVAAAPADRAQWTMLGIAFALTAATALAGAVAVRPARA